ncbi:hypothetical protein HK104_001059 [Borealophlyctis nickersoniae]|nr:hypothetical protein HK104_001059 [Borealophlyctis nickersoniae]
MMGAPKADKAQIDKVFQTFDYNGNGLLSLAEIDRAIIEVYPQYANDKPAIMRAYKAADSSGSYKKSGDGFVDRAEFGNLLEYLVTYDEIYQKFKKLDSDNDHRVSFDEFKKAHGAENEATVKKEFQAIDKNNGGFILFDEFCKYMTKKQLGK